jgi:hypothetical protein
VEEDLNKRYPSNSILKKPEDKPTKRVERVVSGAVRQRKAPFLDQMFGGETAREIAHYVLWDVLVPAAKSTISDIVSNSIEMALYGTTDRRRSLRRDRDRTYVNYARLSSGPRSSRWEGRRDYDNFRGSRARKTHRFDDIVLDRRTDAEEVLTVLLELVDQYGMATVADFYDAVGMASEYTDRRYGWTELEEATVRPVRGGFILDMPRTHVIN